MKIVINTKEFKDDCSKLLAALDKTSLYTISDVVGLYTEEKYLKLCITNRVYYVEIKHKLDYSDDFRATVNAETFLKLVSNITTETIILEVTENNLIIHGNGLYKVPLIYENDKMLNVYSLITVDEPSITTSIAQKDLKKIAQYNSRELQKQIIADPVQKMYYLDENGCLTFSSGATLTDFLLDRPIKLLLQPKIIKLFKLFNTDVKIDYFISKLSDSYSESKVRFSQQDIVIETLLNDESMINRIPVSAIRLRANKEYDYSITINKNEFIRILNIIALLNNTDLDSTCLIEYNDSDLLFFDEENSCSEKIRVDELLHEKYQFKADCKDLLLAAQSISSEYFTLNFGDHNAIVLTDSINSIKFVVPEVM